MRTFEPDLLRRYPHPMSERFRDVASDVLDVPRGWVLVGNGSDDLLTMLCRACLEPGRAAACPMPTYVYYRTLTHIQDAPFIEVPFDERYNLPVDELATAGGAVTFIASPNSPSGTSFPVELLDDLASRLDGLLVVDEAYVDFARRTALELVRRRENVVVLRTLSKGYSMAGLRLGFGIMRPEVAAVLRKVKDHYNVGALNCAIGAAALADQEWVRSNANQVIADRDALAASLRAMDWTVWPSEANFLLARPPAGDAEQIYESLKVRGILVRYFKQPRLDDKLRITVGTAADNAALLEALRAL
jgi:histidinol-phosphate aminotransferase